MYPFALLIRVLQGRFSTTRNFTLIHSNLTLSVFSKEAKSYTSSQILLRSVHLVLVDGKLRPYQYVQLLDSNHHFQNLSWSLPGHELCVDLNDIYSCDTKYLEGYWVRRKHCRASNSLWRRSRQVIVADRSNSFLITDFVFQVIQNRSACPSSLGQTLARSSSRLLSWSYENYHAFASTEYMIYNSYPLFDVILYL